MSSHQPIIICTFDQSAFCTQIAFGVRLIFRAHGSAVLKALIPAMASILILYGIMHIPGYDIAADIEEKQRMIAHPYAIGALLAAFSFLIVFRANFAYGRWWEACANIHQMHSKWNDMATCLASFHYQSSIYSKIRPPAFGNHDSLQQDILLARELNPCTPDEMRQQLDEIAANGRNDRRAREAIIDARGSFIAQVTRPVRMLTPSRSRRLGGRGTLNRADDASSQSHGFSITSNTSQLERIVSVAKLDGGLQGHEPSLFLQEVAHLMSLMSAVAFSTLRGGIEGTEIPLIEYIPGTKWPPVDPDCLDAEIREGYHSNNRILLTFRWLFGLTRTRKELSLYNAARPFRVLGGVAHAEECKRLVCQSSPLQFVAARVCDKRAPCR